MSNFRRRDANNNEKSVTLSNQEYSTLGTAINL